MISCVLLGNIWCLVLFLLKPTISNKRSIQEYRIPCIFVRHMSWTNEALLELIVLPALISKHVLLLCWSPTGTHMNGYCCCITLYMHYTVLGIKYQSICVSNAPRFVCKYIIPGPYSWRLLMVFCNVKFHFLGYSIHPILNGTVRHMTSSVYHFSYQALLKKTLSFLTYFARSVTLNDSTSWWITLTPL